MSSFQGPGAVHPLADYQLVVVADSSTAQDSARSSQFGFHAVPIVQEGAPLPPSQALWQQEILGQQRVLAQGSTRGHTHLTAARHHHHRHHAPHGEHPLGVHQHPAQLRLAPLVTSAASDVVRADAASSAHGTGDSCVGGGSSGGSKRFVSGHQQDNSEASGAWATAPGTPPHIDGLLRAAQRVAGQVRMRLCGSKRPSEGAEGGTGDTTTGLRPVSPTTGSLLANALVSWQWDAFAFVAGCHVRPLATLSLHLLRVSGLVEHFGLPLDSLAAWLGRVEEGYSAAHPYHNAIHAADVLQKMHMIMSPAGGLLAALGGDPLLLLASYLAAVVHDYQHTGVTNSFLVTVGHDLAVTYNDSQPHENHHIAAAWRLMRSRHMDFLSGMPQEQRTRLRRLMIQLVLATDMQQHAPLTQRFSGLVQQAAAGGGYAAGAGPPGLLQEQQELVLQVALKVADLGHLTSSWPVHQRWVAALEEEFFQQGDQERAQGLPLTPMMDRRSPGISSSQTGFLDAVALPLFSSLALAVPGCRPLLAAAQHNRDCWQQYAAAAAANAGS